MTCRGRANLLNVGDVLGDRVRRDQIFFTERSFDAAAIEVSLGAKALNASGGSGMAGMIVTRQGLVDRQGIFAVGGRRAVSRYVGVHNGIVLPLMIVGAIIPT